MICRINEKMVVFKFNAPEEGGSVQLYFDYTQPYKDSLHVLMFPEVLHITVPGRS